MDGIFASIVIIFSMSDKIAKTIFSLLGPQACLTFQVYKIWYKQPNLKNLFKSQGILITNIFWVTIEMAKFQLVDWDWFTSCFEIPNTFLIGNS